VDCSLFKSLRRRRQLLRARSKRSTPHPLCSQLSSATIRISLLTRVSEFPPIDYCSFISGRITSMRMDQSAFSRLRSSNTLRLSKLVTLRHTIYSVADGYNIPGEPIFVSQYNPIQPSMNRACKLIAASFEIAERDRPSPTGGSARSSAYSSIRLLRNTSVSSVWKQCQSCGEQDKTACYLHK
jgi:hypothetical protein